MEDKGYKATIRSCWQDRVNQSKQKTFLIADDQKYSYEQVDHLVNQRIKILKSWGIKAGDLVALQFELDVEDVVTILACIKLGAVANPLNPHFDIDEIKDLTCRFKPFVIISQKTVRSRDTLSNIKSLTNYTASDTADLHVFIRNSHETIFPETNQSQSPVVVLNTSGTSSTPKGVVLTNENILSAEEGYTQAFKITANDMILLPSGMYHAIGFHHGLIATILAGNVILLMKHYNCEALGKLLSKYPVTCIDSLPTIMYDILFKIAQLGTLRQLICGGDKLKPEILQKAKERGIPLYNCYGSTEAVPFSYTPAEYFVQKKQLTTAVVPISGVSVRLVTAGRQIGRRKNVQGTIEVQGPNVFKEYLFDPDKTRAAFDGEWFNTGDIGHYNEDWLLEIDGRRSDKIIRGGEKISAQAVEDKVIKCQNIGEVAVLGIPDIRLGQRIGAFIVLKEKSKGLTKEQLISELKTNEVDKKLWPERLWLVDKLPRTANGKIKKYLLKQLAEE